MNLTERLSNVKVEKPCWDGPEANTRNGGVTQSLLGKFLSCPERFKAKVIHNWKPRDQFNYRLEFGNMFHLCDEIYNKGDDWKQSLKTFIGQLIVLYPFSQEEILKWYRVCELQFPVYIDHWSERSTFEHRTSLLQEQTFKVPYKLPSGRTVYLRGKWDGVELIDGGIYLYESKTKSEIDREKIERRLRFDLQTMFYLVALREYDKGGKGHKNFDGSIKGVLYNVIRRPLSGGKGTIRQTKNESVDEYYNRLKKYIVDEPHEYFARWTSDVLPSDIESFEYKTLIPCLERLCSWYDYMTTGINKTSLLSHLHFTMPYGVYHVSDEYGQDYDDYVMTGSTVGLEKCSNLFTELDG